MFNVFCTICCSVKRLVIVFVGLNHYGSREQGLDPVKKFKCRPPAPGNLFLTVPSQNGTTVVVPHCYFMLLCPCVYGLQRYGQLNNSCAFCFRVLFCVVVSKII